MRSVSRVDIDNFRSCQHLVVDFQRFTPIVGPNNAGKSNIIRALKWCISPEVLKLDDFHHAADGNPVQVTMVLNGITDAVLDRMPENQRKAVALRLDNERLTIRRAQAAPGGSKRDIKLYVLNPGTGAYDLNPTGIDNALKVLFPEIIHIEAMIDAASDVAKVAAGNTIGKLLKLITSNIQKAYATELSQAMEPFRNLLSADSTQRAPEITRLDADTNEALTGLFPGIEACIHIPEPALDMVFKGATIKVRENGKPFEDFLSMGHGTQRAVQMALVQALAKQQTEGEQFNLLLIDEPELYLHPQAIEQVREALLALSRGQFQVLFSTHSPQMILADDIPKTLILRKENGGTSCRTMARTVEQEIQDHAKQSEILFSLSGNSQILFCDNVLLAEGKTERHLLPFLYQAHHGSSMGAHRLGFVLVNGCGSFSGALTILNAMGIPAKAVTDFDFACKKGHEDGFIPCDSVHVQTCKGYVENVKQQTHASEAQAFQQCATDPGCRTSVLEICTAAKTRGCWPWSFGDIEAVLGLPNKDPDNWAPFKQRVQASGLAACVAHADELIDFLNWVRPTA